MEIQEMTARFAARYLNRGDVDAVYALSRKNKLFYQYHPPFVTKQSILEDMAALPPGKEEKDKHYFGFFDGSHLAAVMDLVLDYPQKGTAYIGLFMVEQSEQGKGTGSELIRGCAACLARWGYRRLRLAVDKGNPQSEAFWTKNGFIKTGEEVPNGALAYLPMERVL